MGKIFLNNTGKLPFHTFNDQVERKYLYAFCPQKRIHFNNLNNTMNGSYLFYKTAAEEISGDITTMTDGNCMFYQAKKLKSVKLKSPELLNGRYMFNYCEKLETLELDMGKMTNGYGMFRSTLLTDIVDNEKYNYSSLTNGEYMFANCNNITKVSNAFPVLQSGNYMFYHCENLIEVDTSFPNVTGGKYMFSSCDLSDAPDTPNVTEGYCMYYENKNLTQYTHDLPNLKYAAYMFKGCTNLRVFSASIPKLGTRTDVASTAFDCQQMFCGCKLNKASVLNILNQIKDISVNESVMLTIGADIADCNDQEYISQILSYFDQSTVTGLSGASTFRGYVPAPNKSWFIEFQWN